jgi:phosphoserine phosphatase
VPTTDADDDSRRSVLVRVSGPDSPGITSSLMAQLERIGAVIEDIEQVVIRRHLTLGLAVEVPADASFAGIHDLGTALGLSIEIEPVDATPTERALGTVVTLLAAELAPNQIGAVATAIVRAGGNIDRINRLSRYPVTSYELTVLGAPTDHLRPALVAVAREHAIDMAIQPDGLGRRSQRLVVMDVDSTVIQNEVIDLMAEEAGCAGEVAAVTAAAMAGEIDFEESLRRRVGLMEGLALAALDRVRDRVVLTPGARTFVRTLRRMGFKVAIVSGGFTFVTNPLAADLGVDHAEANELEVEEGRLTGRVVGRVVDRARKAELLRSFAGAEGIPLDQTVAVGDGANDLDMLAAAGLGIAFNAKPIVRDAADATVTVPYLDAVLFLLGVRRSEVEAADHADGAGPQGIRVPIE